MQYECYTVTKAHGIGGIININFKWHCLYCKSIIVLESGIYSTTSDNCVVCLTAHTTLLIKKFRSAKGVHLLADKEAAFSSEDVVTQVFQGTHILPA